LRRFAPKKKHHNHFDSRTHDLRLTRYFGDAGFGTAGAGAAGGAAAGAV
jgi:hypothetical protein